MWPLSKTHGVAVDKTWPNSFYFEIQFFERYIFFELNAD